MVTYAALIIFFTYFYVAITFNPEEVADNMKKYGGFIPGIRAGRPTAEYLQYVLSRITAPGALYLALVALIPVFALVLSVPPRTSHSVELQFLLSWALVLILQSRSRANCSNVHMKVS